MYSLLSSYLMMILRIYYILIIYSHRKLADSQYNDFGSLNANWCHESNDKVTLLHAVITLQKRKLIVTILRFLCLVRIGQQKWRKLVTYIIVIRCSLFSMNCNSTSCYAKHRSKRHVVHDLKQACNTNKKT